MPKSKRTERRKRRAGASNTKRWQKIPDETQKVSIQKTEETLKGGALADRPDSSLFVVDKVGSGAVFKPSRQRKEEARLRMLYTDKALLANPFVHARKSDPNHNKKQSTLNEKKQIAKKVRSLLQSKHAKVTYEIPEVPQPKKAKTKKERKSKVVEPESGKEGPDAPLPKAPVKVDFDLWEDESPAPANLSHKDWLQPENAGNRRIYQAFRTTKVPSVVPAEGGMSYNPSPQEHHDLIVAAVDQEQKKRRELKRLTKNLNPPVVIKPNPPDYEEPDDGVEEPMEERTEKVTLAHVDRKTRRDRNKEKNQRENQRAQRKNLKRKRENAEYGRFGEIQKEHAAFEAKKAKRAETKKEKTEEAEYKTKRLGPEKYVEAPIEVLCTDELPSTLRHVTPKFSLLDDRFRNYRRRNIIENRTPKAQFRKHKPKFVEKYHVKAWKKEQEALYGDGTQKPAPKKIEQK